MEDLLTQENSDLRDRITDLEKRVVDHSDELACLKSALADCLRRMGQLESNNRMAEAGSNANSSAGAISSKLRSQKPSVATANANSAAAPGATPAATSVASATVPRKAVTSGKKKTATTTPTLAKRGRTVSSESVTSTTSNSATTAAARRTAPATGNSTPGRNTTTSTLTRANTAGHPRHAAAALDSSTAQSSASSKDLMWLREEGSLRMFLRGRPINVYAPSDVLDFDVTDVGVPPERNLKLEWVYGYRGRDCRSNVVFLPTGEVLYFMASVAVLYNMQEGSQRHYTGHNDDIKCIALHPDKVTVASGQVAGHSASAKPHVRVWSAVDLSTLHVLGLGVFERAVTLVSFSRADGGELLAAVDDANEHNLSVWQWRKASKVVESKSSADPVLALDFHPQDGKVLATCGKNHVTLWSLDVEARQLSKKQGLFEKLERPKFVLSMLYAANGDLLTGDSNGAICVWRGQKIVQAVLNTHEGGVFALCFLRDDCLVSGGKDRKLRRWQWLCSANSGVNENSGPEEVAEPLVACPGVEVILPEQFGPVRAVAQGSGSSLLVGTTRNALLHGSFELDFSPIVEGHTEELWGLATHPSQLHFLSVAYDRRVILWDALTHSVIWSREIADPAHCVAFHPEGEIACIGTQTGRWMLFDIMRREVVTVHTDGHEQIECCAFNPDGSRLALGSRDNSIYMYSVSEAGRKLTKLGRCHGHSSFVTHIDWSLDGDIVRSTSGDYELLYWIASTCKQASSASSQRDQSWASETCPLGFSVAGIWPEGADGTDVNSVARSNAGSLLAIGDDFGKVSLMHYPARHRKAVRNSAHGHSSHVTNVAFLRDDSRLISCGGRDWSIIQWELV